MGPAKCHWLLRSDQWVHLRVPSNDSCVDPDEPQAKHCRYVSRPYDAVASCSECTLAPGQQHLVMREQRAFGNNAEYLPLFLILFALLEMAVRHRTLAFVEVVEYLADGCVVGVGWCCAISCAGRCGHVPTPHWHPVHAGKDLPFRGFIGICHRLPAEWCPAPVAPYARVWYRGYATRTRHL